MVSYPKLLQKGGSQNESSNPLTVGGSSLWQKKGAPMRRTLSRFRRLYSSKRQLGPQGRTRQLNLLRSVSRGGTCSGRGKANGSHMTAKTTAPKGLLVKKKLGVFDTAPDCMADVRIFSFENQPRGFPVCRHTDWHGLADRHSSVETTARFDGTITRPRAQKIVPDSLAAQLSRTASQATSVQCLGKMRRDSDHCRIKRIKS